jgi:hypothetical protein
VIGRTTGAATGHLAIAFGGEWKLRFGPNNRFRVFYKVDRDA